MKFRKFPSSPHPSPSLRRMENSRVKLLLDFHYLHLSNNQIPAKQEVQNKKKYYIWNAMKHILVTTVNNHPKWHLTNPLDKATGLMDVMKEAPCSDA